MNMFRLFAEKMKCPKCTKVGEDENILAVKNFGFCDECVEMYEVMLLKQYMELADKKDGLQIYGSEIVERCPVTGMPSYCPRSVCASGNCDFSKGNTEWGEQ